MNFASHLGCNLRQIPLRVTFIDYTSIGFFEVVQYVSSLLMTLVEYLSQVCWLEMINYMPTLAKKEIIGYIIIHQIFTNIIRQFRCI